MGQATRTTRRLLPLAVGVVAALVIAAVGAVALPGTSGRERTPTIDVTADAVGVSVSSVPVTEVEPAAAVATEVDLEKIAMAHDSFPKVAKDERAAADARQAQRVAKKQAELEAEAAKQADEERAAEKERLAAEKRAAEEEAKQRAEKVKQDEAAKDDGGHEDKDDGGHKDEDDGAHGGKDDGGHEDEEAPSEPSWWPEHRWAHAVDCTVDVDGQTAVGSWDLWLKYGGDWRFVSASPSPSEVTGTDGDKVKLVYTDLTANFTKQHEDKTKFRGGPVSVIVANAADPSETKTFDVDLWVAARDDGTCPA